MAFGINIYGCQLYPRHGHLSVNQHKTQAIVRDCRLDAVGSWQIILPMPNLERPY